MSVRPFPTVFTVRAASPDALAVAVGKQAEAARRTSSGEHVLVVYEAGGARVYLEEGPRRAPRVVTPALAARRSRHSAREVS